MRGIRASALSLVMLGMATGCADSKMGTDPAMRSAAPATRSALATNTQPGCYDVGDQKVVFVIRHITAAQTQWNNIAGNSDCSTTSLWDDKKYWYSSPPNRPNYYLMMAWHDVNSGYFGYLMVQNAGGVWQVFRDNSPFTPETVPEGGYVRHTWKTNGYRIAMSVENPVNGQGGFTADDILVSIGR